MQVTIQNNKSPANELNGRYYKTFTPRSAQELIKIHHLGCVGNTEVKNIQLEQGNKPTGYVEATEKDTVASGMLNDLRNLNISLTDPNSALWGRIRASNKALMTEYVDKEVKSVLAQTASQIATQVQGLNDKYTRLTQTVEGIETRVSNNVSESFTTQLADLRKQVVSNTNSTSVLQQTADTLTQTIRDSNNNLSRMQQTVDGLSSTVESVNGNMSNLRQNVDSISASVAGKLSQSDIRVTGDGITLGSKQINGNNLIGMINKSTLILNPDGVDIDSSRTRIKGELIADGTITAKQIKGESITVDQLDVANVKAGLIKAKLLEAYSGKIGGFLLQKDANGDAWLTSSTNGYDSGIGVKYSKEHHAALWANWGNDWNNPNDTKWVVYSDGTMECGNGMTVKRGIDIQTGGLTVRYGGSELNNGTVMRGGTTIYNKTTIHDGLVIASGNIDVGTNYIYGKFASGKKASVVWEEASDQRLKTNIKKTTKKCLPIINSIEMVQFDWKNSGKHEELGLIAQQAMKHIPKIAHLIENYYTVDYTKVVPFLIKAVQELSERIDKYEQQA
jgi:hypothetical protein|uniref:Neck appendage protein n=1 Tax=Siphoviridae sp. ctpoI7 TaxID=2825678 RepID=A0A8S5PAP9_9CAUD|nr:MAG TPA: Neck appendage protein [Siphoviridae sp. ctpoI7]